MSVEWLSSVKPAEEEEDIHRRSVECLFSITPKEEEEEEEEEEEIHRRSSACSR